MNIEEIETFLMIVKTKNITKTAENLFLSQPTVSHRLKVLESELGMKLVIRQKGHKAVELTEKGEEFITIAQRWISLWREMQLLKDGQERSILTLAATDTVNTCILGDFYKSYLEMEPTVDLCLRTHQSYEIYDLVERHEADAGFVYHRLQYKNIIARPLFKEKMYIVRYDSGDNVQFREGPVKTADLNPQKELYLSWESNFQIWHEQWIGGTVRPRLTVDSFEVIRSFFATGNYWMIAPVSIIRALKRTLPVVVNEIANDVTPPHRTTFLVRHKNPSVAACKAVDLFENRFIPYLSGISWDIV